MRSTVQPTSATVKTKAVVSVSDDVPMLVTPARKVLDREDLSIEQRRKIAETLSRRAVSFEMDTEITVGKGVARVSDQESC